MNATTQFQRIRQLLDDPVESSKRKGNFWTDAEIVSALNFSQMTIVSYLCKKKEDYLLQNLITNITGNISVQIPTNYFYHLAGQVLLGGIYRPAQLYLCGIARTFWYSGHYCVSILKDFAYFRSSTGYEQGKLIYYRKPSVMTIDSGSPIYYEADTFDRTLYDVIANHAAACLAVRQEPTARLTKNLQQSIQFLLKDPKEQIPKFEEGVVA